MADRRRRNSWPFVPTHLTTTPMPLAANPGECPHCGYHHDNHDACEHREEDDGDS